eukprot:1277079-Pyramimonas_sp.AAC.1
MRSQTPSTPWLRAFAPPPQAQRMACFGGGPACLLLQEVTSIALSCIGLLHASQHDRETLITSFAN